MPQLAFRWPAPASYAPEDFIVSASNAQAVEFLERWPAAAGDYGALLTGPASCGKTHLGRCWMARTGAPALEKERLGLVPSAELWPQGRHALLEDIHAVTDEAPLFHLLRHAETHGLFLLMTSRIPAREMNAALPDLRSRLLALPQVSIALPDETLLRVFAAKCLADRQLRVSGEVVEYLLRRIERSFLSVLGAVEKMERHAFETKREITIPWVKSLMENA